MCYSNYMHVCLPSIRSYSQLCSHVQVEMTSRRFIEKRGVGYTVRCPAMCEGSEITESHHFRLMGKDMVRGRTHTRAPTHMHMHMHTHTHTRTHSMIAIRSLAQRNSFFRWGACYAPVQTVGWAYCQTIQGGGCSVPRGEVEGVGYVIV